MNIFNNLENIKKLIVKTSLLIVMFSLKSMQHNFDLLGSGLVNVNYGLTPNVEGIVFKDDIKNIPFNNILNKYYDQ